MSINSPFPHPFWCAFHGVGPTPKCLDEWLIIEISNSIREKNSWKRKYKDPNISAKWQQEIRTQYINKTKFIDEVIDFVFRELEWYEKIEDSFPGLKESGFVIGCDDKIVFSERAIDNGLKQRFQNDVGILVKSFGANLDYHPNSKNQVIDLVHPSLFPLQYGVTPIIGDDNKVKIVKFSKSIGQVKRAVEEYGISFNFQWLPALLKFDKKTQAFEFKSYINNLHPLKQKSVYESIQSVFNQILPGLSFILTRYASEEYVRIKIPEYDGAYDDAFEKGLNELEEKLDDEAEKTGEEFDYDKLEEYIETKIKYLKSFPPVYKNEPKSDIEIDLSKDFENLKVIVKLANIELTPENPKYEGGSWHVEGTINEDVIATVLYYYDSENISESRLSFRTGFEDPKYEQNDHVYSKEIYGIEDGDEMIRNIGSVEAKEDRVVIFPNCFQHHVDAFELLDTSKKGHRKILCFFLVDPYNDKVIATDKVPPQQKEWWDDSDLISSLVANDIKEQILELKKMKWPQTLDEAKGIREKLMGERSLNTSDDDDGLGAFVRQFSLCEH